MTIGRPLIRLADVSSHIFSVSCCRPAATDYQRIAKLDMENEVKPPSTVSPSVGAAIAKGRQDKKDAEGKSMSQKDLATKINEKPSVVSRESPFSTLSGSTCGRTFSSFFLLWSWSWS
jgi:hypothetical protein